MNKAIESKIFKYNGQKFMLIENDLDFTPGFRFKAKGINIISVSKNLPTRKKLLWIHRLITCRGLRNARKQFKSEYGGKINESGV